MPIQRELYEVDVISAEKINDILNESDFITVERHLRFLQDVSNRVKKEHVEKMKNCELTVVFHNISGSINDRVKHIVIKAGKPKHKINCSLDSDGTFNWNSLENYKGADVPTDSYRCELITRYEINKILNKSTFLEKKSHRNFLASKVRTAVDKEFQQVLQNCTLTIELEDLDAANIRIKIIKIKAGEGENEVLSSEENPWQATKRTDAVTLLYGLWSFYNGTFGRIWRFCGSFMDMLERVTLRRVERQVDP